MTRIELTVAGARAWATVTGPLTSGMVGIPVTIQYDEAWNVLTKNLLCRCGRDGSGRGEQRAILNAGTSTTVAHEVLKPGMHLFLGVEGCAPDGQLVIPTTWADCGEIQSGANTGADLSADPTLPIWGQLQAEIEQIKENHFPHEQLSEIQAHVQSAVQAADSAVGAVNAAASVAQAAAMSAGRADSAAARAENAVDSLKNHVCEIPIGGEVPGGVKNGGNVVINTDGTMTVPDTGLTPEQVRTALDGYIADNPGAITAGATPEQAASIEFALATDAALFATLATGNLYEVDLTGWTWTDGVMLGYVESANWWEKTCPVEGHHYSNTGYIDLRKGDILITNADTPVHGYTAERIGCLLRREDGTFLMEGRGKYDGLYRCYTATEVTEHIMLSYKYDVDYDVHFYVARAREDAEIVPYDYVSGYIKANTGEVFEASETNRFQTGYDSEVVSSLITISAPGKFLLVKNVKFPKGKGGYCWAKYAEDGTLEHGLSKERWGTSRNYYIVPLFKDTEYIRLNYVMNQNPYHLTEALLVDAEYLVRNGYADRMAGKSLAMFGDSYVAGHSMGAFRTWHYMFAEQHQMQYFNHGTNGLGLVKSPNIGDGMIDRCDTVTEADYIGVICGRNDYSVQVPIGTNEDVSTPEMGSGSRTFKGGLNYLCQYLVENFPDKKIFFLTPWFFPSRADITETHKPQEYIDAILEITGLWGIPCFDAARRSGIHCRSEVFRSQYFLSVDDVSHLNETGAKLMMEHMTGWMLGL